jgi:hypothetical protein
MYSPSPPGVVDKHSLCSDEAEDVWLSSVVIHGRDIAKDCLAGGATSIMEVRKEPHLPSFSASPSSLFLFQVSIQPIRRIPQSSVIILTILWIETDPLFARRLTRCDNLGSPSRLIPASPVAATFTLSSLLGLARSP